jgi:hypothetical protein
MLIRNRGEILGTVEAPGEQAAEQVAAERFGLIKEQLARLALREMRVGAAEGKLRNPAPWRSE